MPTLGDGHRWHGLALRQRPQPAPAERARPAPPEPAVDAAWKKCPHADTTRTSSLPPAYSDRQMAQRSAAFPSGAGGAPAIAAAARSYVVTVAAPSARSTSAPAIASPGAAS